MISVCVHVCMWAYDCMCMCVCVHAYVHCRMLTEIFMGIHFTGYQDLVGHSQILHGESSFIIFSDSDGTVLH